MQIELTQQPSDMWLPRSDQTYPCFIVNKLHEERGDLTAQAHERFTGGVVEGGVYNLRQEFEVF